MPPSFHHLESLSTKSFFARIKKMGAFLFLQFLFLLGLKVITGSFIWGKLFSSFPWFLIKKSWKSFWPKVEKRNERDLSVAKGWRTWWEKKNLISDFFFMSLFVDEKLEKIQYLFRRRKSQYLAPTTFKQFPPRTRIFLLDDQSNYKVFFTTYSQTALLYLWQIALLGFFLPPYAAAWSERELAYLWACFKPMSVELHQTGTFEGLSTNWATAPQRFNYKVEPCW